MARSKQTAQKSNKGLPKATKGEQAEKAVAVALAVAEVEAAAVAVALAVVEAVAVAVAVAWAVVTEIGTQKEMFRVDVSVNNWKTDLQLQPISGKSHTCGLSRK